MTARRGRERVRLIVLLAVLATVAVVAWLLPAREERASSVDQVTTIAAKPPIPLVKVKRLDSPPVASDEVRCEGLVVDVEGRPVVGAHVTVTNYFTHDARTVVTDADGMFTFTDFATTTVIARLGNLISNADSCERARPLDLTLHRGTRLEIVVVDEANKPVERATVRGGSDVSVLTDARGSAVLEPSPRVGPILVTADGYVPAELDHSESAILSTRSTIRIVLPRGARISGSVIAPSGPVANAIVQFETEDGGFARSTLTDQDGRWSTLLAMGRHFAATASARGMVPDKVTGFDVTGPVDTVVVRVKPVDYVLSGVVVDEADRPVSGARVSAISRNYLLEQQETSTNSDGEFLFRVQRDEWHVTARHGDRAVAARGGEGLKLVLESPSSSILKGTVVDHTGAPRRGVEVFVECDEPYAKDATTTNARGEFEIAPLPRCDYRIFVGNVIRGHGTPGSVQRIVLPGNRRVAGRVTVGGKPLTEYVIFGALEGQIHVSDIDGRFSIEVDSTLARELLFKATSGLAARRVPLVGKEGLVDLGTIELPELSTVTGRVVDWNGRPVEGAVVSIIGPYESTIPSSDATDAGGTFRLATTGTTGSISVVTPVGSATVPLGKARDVVITLLEHGEIVGRAPARASIEAFTPDVPQSPYSGQAQATSEGRYVMSVPLGEYAVSLAGSSESKRVIVRRGVKAVVDFD